MAENVRWITAAEVAENYEPIGGGVGLLTLTEVTLTNAQIIGLSSLRTIVPSAGLGTRQVFIWGQAVLDNTAGVYDNVDAAFEMGFRSSNNSEPYSIGNQSGWIFTDGSEAGLIEFPTYAAIAGGVLNGNSDYASAFDNTGIGLYYTNGAAGAITLGNAANTMKVKVYSITLTF